MRSKKIKNYSLNIFIMTHVRQMLNGKKDFLYELYSNLINTFLYNIIDIVEKDK